MANITRLVKKYTLSRVGLGVGEVDVDITTTDFTINNGVTPFIILCTTTIGDVKVDYWDGTTGTTTLTETYKEKPVLVTKVYKTGTSAEGLKAIY